MDFSGQKRQVFELIFTTVWVGVYAAHDTSRDFLLVFLDCLHFVRRLTSDFAVFIFRNSIVFTCLS